MHKSTVGNRTHAKENGKNKNNNGVAGWAVPAEDDEGGSEGEMTKILIDYVEDYFKAEGLLSLIHPSRRKVVLQSPLQILIWFGGLLGVTILMTRGFGSFWVAVGFFLFSLIVFIFAGVIFSLYYQLKNIKSTGIVEAIFLFAVYPLVLLGFIFVRTVGWVEFAETLISFILFLFLFSLVALESYTQIFTIGLRTLQTFIQVIGKSLSALLVVAPLLLLVVILSVFSQDIWLILGDSYPNMYWAALIVLIAPPILVSYAKLKDLSKSLIVEHKENTDNLSILESIKFFQRITSAGFISHKELLNTRNDLAWRSNKKAFEKYERKINRSVTFRLLIYIEAITVFLVIIFFLYFLLLFFFLIHPATIAQWINYPLDYEKYKLFFIPIPSTIDVTAKVSFFLSVVVSVMARISIINDDSFKEKTLSWLSEKSRDWASACAVSDCLLYPNYQFWKYKARNQNVLNSHIVLHPGLDENQIKSACYHYLNLENENANLQIVTAFEKEENREDYDFGKPGKRWQLLINKKNKIVRFSDITLGSDESVQYAHNLGFECLEKDRPIPDSWFGDDTLTVHIAKEIWNTDSDHTLIWHPYVNKTNDLYFIEICLTRRFPRSKDYVEFSKKILGISTNNLRDYTSINLRIEFRDSMEALASADYFKPTDLVTYKDEYTKKTKYSKYRTWVK